MNRITLRKVVPQTVLALRPASREVQESGFNLVELTIVMTLFTLLTAAGMALFIEGQKHLQRGMNSSTLADSGHRALGQMSHEIAMAGFPGSKSFTAAAVSSFPGIVANSVVAASGYDLTFEADIDGDGLVEQVQYVLPTGSQTLLRNITKKNPDGTLAANSAVTQSFLDHVQNQILGQQLFTWQVDSSSPKPFPQNIRTVYINVILKTSNGGSQAANLNLMVSSRRINP